MIGCPAPKRCNGLSMGRFIFAVIIMSASRSKRYCCMISVGLPKAWIWNGSFRICFADLVMRSRCWPPWIGPTQRMSWRVFVLKSCLAFFVVVFTVFSACFFVTFKPVG